MTGNDDDRGFSRLRDYLQNAVALHEPSTTVTQGARSFIKRIFDVLRNVMIVGVLFYLAKVSGSKLLWVLALGTLALFPAYLSTYWEERTLRPLHFMREGRLRSMLEFGLVMTALFVLYFGCAVGMTILVSQIADGYMATQSSTEAAGVPAMGGGE